MNTVRPLRPQRGGHASALRPQERPHHQRAKGNFDGSRQVSTIGANDQLVSSSDYGALIVTYQHGTPVRLSDVADVIDSAENVKQAAWMNAVPAIIVNVQRQPGANIIKVVDRVKELLPKLKSSLPAALGGAVMAIEQVTREIGLPATMRGSFQGIAQAFQDSLASQPLLITAALAAVYIVLGILSARAPARSCAGRWASPSSVA